MPTPPEKSKQRVEILLTEEQIAQLKRLTSRRSTPRAAEDALAQWIKGGLILEGMEEMAEAGAVDLRDPQ